MSKELVYRRFHTLSGVIPVGVGGASTDFAANDYLLSSPNCSIIHCVLS
jgi:hypothetical protein